MALALFILFVVCISLFVYLLRDTSDETSLNSTNSVQCRIKIHCTNTDSTHFVDLVSNGNSYKCNCGEHVVLPQLPNTIDPYTKNLVFCRNATYQNSHYVSIADARFSTKSK